MRRTSFQVGSASNRRTVARTYDYDNAKRYAHLGMILCMTPRSGSAQDRWLSGQRRNRCHFLSIANVTANSPALGRPLTAPGLVLSRGEAWVVNLSMEAASRTKAAMYD